jgi:putative acetyltransferase
MIKRMDIQNTGIGHYSWRPAVNEDSHQVRTVIFNALIEHGLEPDPEITDKDLYDIEQFYRAHFFGVILDERNSICGTFALYLMNENSGEIRKMYLEPSARGKGLGGWMMQFLIKKAKDLGVTTLELETASCLTDAIELYKKYGFTDAHPENKSPRCDRKMFLSFI